MKGVRIPEQTGYLSQSLDEASLCGNTHVETTGLWEICADPENGKEAEHGK